MAGYIIYHTGINVKTIYTIKVKPLSMNELWYNLDEEGIEL